MSQHKRLRERAWVLPVPSSTAGLEQIARPALLNIYAPSLGLPLASTSQTTPSPFSPHSPANPSKPPAPATSTASTEAQAQQPAAALLDPVDVEFEQLWEKEWVKSDGSGITQEDLAAMRAETERAKGLR